MSMKSGQTPKAKKGRRPLDQASREKRGAEHTQNVPRDNPRGLPTVEPEHCMAKGVAVIIKIMRAKGAS
jgi:hypothetical protein